MSEPTFFDGYPPAGRDFLAELEANKHREWFEAYKHIYLDALVASSRVLVEGLAAI